MEEGLLRRVSEVFNCHRPTIELYPDARVCLATVAAQDMKIGLMAHGPGNLQRNKVAALELEPLVDSMLYTSDLLGGRERTDFWPDPFYVMELEMEITLAKTVFVGDNPLTDFLTPRRLGMGAVRIARRQGAYVQHVPLSQAHAPHVTIPSLDMLGDVLAMVAARKTDPLPNPGPGAAHGADTPGRNELTG